MEPRTIDVQQIYDGLASKWRLLDLPSTLLGINRLRSMFHEAEGEVLDVACGTGENFKHLSGASSIVAFDVSSEMVKRARRRGGRASLAVADAQAMPFEDASFDTVVSAMSSCTFPDYVAAFSEMSRVLRPGGRLMLFEHGRSSVGWIARRQDRTASRVLQSSGCRHNRDPLADLEQAGLTVISHHRSHLGMVHRIVAVP